MIKVLGEIKGIKEIKDQPLLVGFSLDDGSAFYLEHTFLTQLHNLLSIHKDKKQPVLDEIERVVKKNRRVLFVHNYEFPMIDLKDYYILEIEDILNPLHIFVEDKSRGSDYGD